MEQVIVFEGPGSLQDGSGYGYGSGYGSGYWYGDGDGSGYGSGYGSGDSIACAAYWASVADVPEAQAARAAGAVVALWKSRADGVPANGGHLPPVKVGDMHEVKGPLELCTNSALHATFTPNEWKGERLWVVALHGEVAVQKDKLGALKREILAEIV